MAVAEHGRTVAADGGLQHVAAVEGVADTTVERNVAHGLLGAALYGWHAVDGAGVGQLVPLQIVVEEVVYLQTEAVVGVALLPGVTGHD